MTAIERSRRVVVVGAGAAGAMVAIQLCETAARRHVSCDLTLIDPAPEAGRGAAFGTPDPRLRLNVPAGNMSCYPDDPGHFVRWLCSHGEPGITHTDFAPRYRYGSYLADTLGRAIVAAQGTVTVRRVRALATGCRWSRRADGHETARIDLSHGPAVEADAVVLATGPFSADPSWAPPELRATDRFVADPWAPGALAGALAKGQRDEILLVGTGLTAIDMALLLDRPRRTLHALSRGGRLPQAHAFAPATAVAPPALPQCLPHSLEGLPHSRAERGRYPQRNPRTGASSATSLTGLSLAGVRSAVLRHIVQVQRAYGDWRPALDALRPVTAEVWASLSERERAEFVERDGSLWNVHRHRMPPATAEAVGRMRRTRRLRPYAGTLTSVAPQQDGSLAVTIDDRGGPRTLSVDWVVNCTGPGLALPGTRVNTDHAMKDRAKKDRAENGHAENAAVPGSTDPLWCSLLDGGAAVPGPLRMGVRTEDGRLRDAAGRADRALWTLGAPRRGELWETTAVPEIRVQAEGIAQAVLAPWTTPLTTLDQTGGLTDPAEELTHSAGELTRTTGELTDPTGDVTMASSELTGGPTHPTGDPTRDLTHPTGSTGDLTGSARRGGRSTHVPGGTATGQAPARSADPEPRRTRRPRRPRDVSGFPLTTHTTAAAAYRTGVNRLLKVRSGAREAFRRAVALDPGFALAHTALALVGHECGASVDVPRALADARRCLREGASAYEQSFTEVVARRVQGSPVNGDTALMRHLDAYPDDALALAVAVPTIAFSGLYSLPDGTARHVVERTAQAHHGHWFHTSLLAFMRQEESRFDEAGELAERSLAAEPGSGHAMHALAHVRYERGEHEQGRADLDRWLAHQGRGGSHRAHFAWHAALHELALTDTAAVRRRWAEQLAPGKVSGIRALVDSGSLLWRARTMDGWQGSFPARDVLENVPADVLERPATAFVALHAGVALTAAGDLPGLRRLHDHAVCADPVQREVIAPLCTALEDVVEERWAPASRRLERLLPRLRPVGGSAAQREVIEETLLYALVSGGRHDAARAQLERRLDRRPSPQDRRRLAALREPGAPARSAEA